MVNLYVDLIHKGKRTIEQVPPKWREEVRAIIEAENKPEPTEVK